MGRIACRPWIPVHTLSQKNENPVTVASRIQIISSAVRNPRPKPAPATPMAIAAAVGGSAGKSHGCGGGEDSPPLIEMEVSVSAGSAEKGKRCRGGEDSPSPHEAVTAAVTTEEEGFGGGGGKDSSLLQGCGAEDSHWARRGSTEEEGFGGGGGKDSFLLQGCGGEDSHWAHQMEIVFSTAKSQGYSGEDLPPSRELVIPGSAEKKGCGGWKGGFGGGSGGPLVGRGWGGSRRHGGGGGGGLLDVLKETLDILVEDPRLAPRVLLLKSHLLPSRGVQRIEIDGILQHNSAGGVRLGHSGRGEGGLRTILEEGLEHMVAPSKLRAAGFQTHFNCGGRDRGEDRGFISGVCHMASADLPLEINASSFAKKIPSEQARSVPVLKKIWEFLKSQKRGQQVPQPKPSPKAPRLEEMSVQPKPVASLYKLYKHIRITIKRFIGNLGVQIPIALLFLCGFVAASVSTLRIWYDRNQTFLVNFGHLGNKIVVIADDIFWCQSSRSELVKVCNSGVCDLVIPSSVIHCLETSQVGIKCQKTAPALLFIKDLLEAGKVRVFQDPMSPNYKENILRTVVILNLMYPRALVSIATNNRFLRR